jgi:septum formation protein
LRGNATGANEAILEIPPEVGERMTGLETLPEMSETARLVLASASPRRAAILRGLGVPFRRRIVDVDETVRPGEAPTAACERLARDKAKAAAACEALPVLGADTLVVCEGAVLGKPASTAEAESMLRLLSGRTHEVVTGLCLAVDGVLRSRVDRTSVTFACLTDGDVAWYVGTGEPLDKAGAYHVDGGAALFITSVSGSPSGVAGLPVRLLLELAREAAVDIGLP